MGRSPSRLRQKILIPVAGAAALVLAIFVYGFNFVLDATVHADFARDARSLRAFWTSHTDNRAAQLSRIGETIAEAPALQRMLAAADHAGLAGYAGPLLARLRVEARVDLLQFLDADRRLLAGPNPADPHGAPNTLAIVGAAAASGAPAAGLDVCDRGHTAVRAAIPVRADGRTLGFVVVGQLADHLLDEMDALFATRHLLLLERRYLAGRGIAPGPTAATLAYDPDGFAGSVPVRGSVGDLPAAVTEALRTGRFAPLEEGMVVEHAGGELLAGLLPLTSSSGETLGQVLFTRDVSPSHRLFQRTTRLTGAAAVTLSLVMFGIVYGVTTRAQTDFDGFYARLARANRDWTDSIDAIREPIFLHDRDYRILRANRAYAARAGMAPEAVIGRLYWEVFPKGDGPMAVCRQVMEEERRGSFDERLRIDSGETFLARAFPIYDEAGGFRFSVHIMEEVTAYEATMEALRREVRARRTLSLSNNALIRARDEAELLETICAVITESGYTLAWVGMKRNDLSQRIAPVASSGVGLAELQALDLTWALAATPRTLASEVIRTGGVVVRQDTSAEDHPVTVPVSRFGCRAGIGFPLSVRGDTFGCLIICGTEPNAFSDEEVALLGELASDLAFGLTALRSRGQLDNAEMERLELLRKLEDSLAKTVQAMANALEARDPYTAGHQRRVADLAVAIARELELPETQVEAVRIAAVVHDIGKIYVPAELLSKPGRLAPLEFELVKTHSQVSYEILKDIDFPWPIADIVHQHHERLDGSGYPHGLAGDAILPEARIIAVADVIEAMASHRPYRPALTIELALDEIERYRGTRYDPDVVDACATLFRHRGYRLES